MNNRGIKASYIAGLFDGEGYVAIKRTKPRPKDRHKGYNDTYQVYAGINMCDPQVIKMLADRFDGGVYSLARKNPKHRTLYSWMITSTRALKFLKTIRRYLIIKAKEVDVAFEFQEHLINSQKNIKRDAKGRRTKIDDVSIAYRESMRQKLSSLKHIQHLA